MTPTIAQKAGVDSDFDCRELLALNRLTTRLTSYVNTDVVARTIDSWLSLNVLTVGDLIVDEYINCESVGISGEDPCMVVSRGASTRFIGGSGIVAPHAKGFCADVSLAAVVSNDANGDWVTSSLATQQVSICAGMRELGRPTPVKTRFRWQEKLCLGLITFIRPAFPKQRRMQPLDRLKRWTLILISSSSRTSIAALYPLLLLAT